MPRRQHNLARRPRGYSGLGVDVVELAIAEMRGVKMADYRVRPDNDSARVRAIAWLASKAATAFFDAYDIDQAWALRKMGWVEHAREVLPVAAKKHARVIRLGLEYLEGSDGRKLP